MSYPASEALPYGGRPVELYRFSTAGQCWHLTSADEPRVYLGETYLPEKIHRAQIRASQEDGAGALEVAFAANLSLAALFVAGDLPAPVGLTVYRGHRGAADADFVVAFDGQVAASRFERAQATLRCVPTEGALNRSVPRQLCQGLCNHVLYDSGCGLSPAAFKTLGTVTALTGVLVTVPEADPLGAGYFTAGFLRIAGEAARGFIALHDAGGTLRLMARVPGLVVGSEVELYAGCDHAVETCHTKFNNLVHFWGFPDVPLSNPFRGLV